MTRLNYYLLIVILVLAASFRLVGLNWDQNHHLHPDERFLTMVAGSLSWPNSISQYFDTNNSPLNPNNQKFDFYVYGTYPVILIKFIAELLHLDSYNSITLVGRFVSALLDIGVVYLVYLISRRLFPLFSSAPLWSAFIYAITVLPIQLSHFFAVDPYLIFFLTLSFYFFILLYQSLTTFKIYIYSCLMGISFGLALGAKISGAILVPTLILGFFGAFFKHKNIIAIMFCGLVFSLFTFITLRISQPYLFSNSNFFTLSLNPKTLKSWELLNFYSQPNHFYPPGTQWVTLQKGIFPFINLMFWGLGSPIGIIFLCSLIYIILIYRKNYLIFLTCFGIVSIFVYQSFQFSQPLRYFYPIYPFIAALCGLGISKISFKKPWLKYLIIPILLLWPISFLSIYIYPHSRVQASQWILKNIPAGSSLSCEYWDDCLPLNDATVYNGTRLEPYQSETPEKWSTLFGELSKVDYLILSSNRLYGSIMTDPKYYPQTTKFYSAIFDGSLGFTKIAEFTSRPNLSLPLKPICLTPPFNYYGDISKNSQTCSLPGISIVDDYSDESFTVYDHPKVIIYKNTSFSVLLAKKIVLGE